MTGLLQKDLGVKCCRENHCLLGCRDTEVSECLRFLSHGSEMIVLILCVVFPICVPHGRFVVVVKYDLCQYFLEFFL